MKAVSRSTMVMRRFLCGFLTPALLGAAVLSPVSAQPLEPLDPEVQALVYGTWVQAAPSIGRAVYEDDFLTALRRCDDSMFTVEDGRLRGLFPSAAHAQGDLSFFPYEDGALLALADGAFPNPRKISAQQMRTQDSLMLRLVSNAFWNGETGRWIATDFVTLNWGDVHVSQSAGGTKSYKMLVVMRPNGDTGLYTKCE